MIPDLTDLFDLVLYGVLVWMVHDFIKGVGEGYARKREELENGKD